MTPGVRSSMGLGLSLLLLGCELEDRTRLGTADVLVEDSLDVAATEMGGADLEVEAAQLTLLQFREWIETGDLSLALRLLHPDARFHDDLLRLSLEDLSRLPTRGERLMELRRLHATGLQLRVLEGSLTKPGDLVVLGSRLLAYRVTEGDPEVETPVAEYEETVVLQLQPEGWIILAFHRSLIPGSQAGS
jgi:hypothetical protein